MSGSCPAAIRCTVSKLSATVVGTGRSSRISRCRHFARPPWALALIGASGRDQGEWFDLDVFLHRSILAVLRHDSAHRMARKGFGVAAGILAVAPVAGAGASGGDICEPKKRGSAFDLGEIRDREADRADAVQQVQTVAAQDLVVGIDLHGVEEGVDGGAQGGHGVHGGLEVFGFHRRFDCGVGGVEGGEQRLFRGILGELDVGAEGVFDAVLLLRPGSGCCWRA